MTSESQEIEITHEPCAGSTELISPGGKVEVFAHHDGRVFVHTLFSLDTPREIDELLAQLHEARDLMVRRQGV